MKNLLLVLLCLYTSVALSQPEGWVATELEVNQETSGTLYRPIEKTDLPLVIIVPDAGPMDRNGNQNFLNNNALKKLAFALAEKNIATFRYDKRMVKQIKMGKLNFDIRFDDFVNDTQDALDLFRDNYEEIYILGYGQGSLVGMLAIDEDIDGFISVSGAGKSLDEVLVEQVRTTAPGLVEGTQSTLISLKSGNVTRDYPQPLSTMFDLEIQPFLISWMKYDPREIISKIEVPILIVNGTKDLQVSVEDAEDLAAFNTNATLQVVDNMNHVMFLIDGDDLVNSKSYNESYHSISEEMVEYIAKFIGDQ